MSFSSFFDYALLKWQKSKFANTKFYEHQCFFSCGYLAVNHKMVFPFHLRSINWWYNISSIFTQQSLLRKLFKGLNSVIIFAMNLQFQRRLIFARRVQSICILQLLFSLENWRICKSIDLEVKVPVNFCTRPINELISFSKSLYIFFRLVYNLENTFSF